MSNPVDLCASEKFVAYIKDFRDRHPLDTELASKHGFLSDIGDSESMRNATSGTFGGGTA